MENVIKIVENKTKESQKFSDHKVFLDNRKKLNLTGVEKVISANDNQIVAKVGGSKMLISGKDLTVTKLDVDAGLLDIIGEIFSIKYSGAPQGFFKRIFR